MNKKIDITELEQLNVIKAYISGWWQWARFALMALIVVVTNLACFNDAARAFFSHALGNLMPTMREDAIARLLPVAGWRSFRMVAETWIVEFAGTRRHSLAHNRGAGDKIHATTPWRRLNGARVSY